MARLINRAATLEDVSLLAQMNKRLIEDERARNPMNVLQLERRMRSWLENGEYQGELFERDGEPVAYALYHLRPDRYFPEQTVAYIHHFYVERAYRRQGLGREALRLLTATRFPAGCTVAVSVLAANPGGYQFWATMGFQPYQTEMKIEREELL